MTALGPCPPQDKYGGVVSVDYAEFWRTAAQEALKYADHLGFNGSHCAVYFNAAGDEEPGTCTCGLTELRRRVEEAK